MKSLAAVAAAVLGASLLPVSWSAAQEAPVGQGFNLDAADLRFILKQIKIAEAHAASATPANPCGTLLGSGTDQIPAGGVGVTLPLGLRTVDGSCNNIANASQNEWGAADNDFPRLVAKKLRAAESGDPDGPGPAPAGPSTYASSGSTVLDSQPRIASNLVVDQTATNPAAVAAAGETPQVDGKTLLIPNTAPDVGLSAPYNSWFTLFGQFFDHGLDLVNKGGVGTVLVPLKSDDPLYVPGSPLNFMVLSRATHDGDHEANNQTSPFVDQSQTYTSHPSHQVFLREYVSDTAGKPVSSGGLITAAGVGGMATWADVKAQAATRLGIQLVDADALAIPLLRTDQYGRFLRGTAGYPQIVTGLGADGVPNTGDDPVVEGDPTADGGAGVLVPASALRIGHAFLDDIAHNAVPKAGTTPDGDATITPGLVPCERPGFPADCVNEYDDEMLDAHFIAGDGRVNENIGLTAVHHVFHAEHNRLTGDIKEVITTEDPAALTEWQLTPGVWNGERIFQAARFVTEMEYQHLAFEEFARKVQPMVNLFGEGGTGYHTEINPAIRAEFAHAVYRFGHSMLNEDFDRVKSDGTAVQERLLDVFLNPPAFMAGSATPEAAAGAVVRGMTAQTGNELDEFVTEALRNNLLGLPLDLATLNMARARETGVPTLNEARRAFYGVTPNSALEPYSSWADYGLSIKHPESLVNFIAAYGTHSSVTGASTLAAKRGAAQAILDLAASPPPPPPDDTPTAEEEAAAAALLAQQEDARAFLNSTGAYASTAGVTTTGVDDVDLWLGGLAEKQHVFGGLLGPTFNYVFEKQMEDLQDGDRFYYLSRTVGLNLLTQLEGNSFAELIQRNTDVQGLPADSFSRPGLTFDLAAQTDPSGIVDDPTTEYDETKLLVREPDGTIRYHGRAVTDAAGVVQVDAGQHVVFNGTAGEDRTHSSEGDDTIRGNALDDRMEGGDGNDNLIGGEGDDIMTDSGGDDTLKGGDGDDAMSSGQGFGGDLNQGGRGNDFIYGGNDTTETFAGAGDDFVFAGDAEDTVFGDDGSDWIEGGTGPFNLLQGDNGAPFQDSAEGGHDVLFSYGGEQDFDAEGGDDVMLLGPGIQRSEGMLGFDWTSHKNDPDPVDSDMRFTGLLPPSVDTNRDRWDLVESMSGWNGNDVLRGDNRVAEDMVGHELTAAGIARIDGLAALLPNGATSFAGGNILIGGAGNDTVEGKGGDDLIDGDAWLDVQLEVRTDAGALVKRVDTMREIQSEVFAGTIDPGNIVIARTIRTGTAGTDVAVFTGPEADYDITTRSDGTTLVAHTRGTAVDGTDTLRNVEQLQFGAAAPIPVPAADTGAPSVVATTPSAGAAVVSTLDDLTVTFSETVLGVDQTTFTLRAGTSTTAVPATVTFNAATRVATLNPSADLAPVTSYTASITGGTNAIRDVAGNALASTTWSFTTGAAGDVTSPTVITQDPAPNAIGVRASRDVTVTFSEPVTGVSGTSFTLTNAGGTAVNATVSANNPSSWALNPARNLPNGSYVVRLTSAITDTSPGRNALAPVTWSFTVGTAVTLDTVAPTVTSTSPVAGATGVSTTTDVVTTFSESVTGVTSSTYVLRETVSGNTVSATLSSAGTTQWRLRPNANLTTGLQYTVELRAGITDNAGNALAPLSRSFTVGTATTPPVSGETTAPTVTARTPAPRAANVARNSNVTATFSEPVTGVSAATFTLQAAGSAVPAAVAYNPATRVATLNPNGNLERRTTYTVTLTGGITDTATTPNALPQPETWTFTTN